MIVRCPECSTAFRVREEIVSPSEVTFRCSRCQHVFIPGPQVRPEAADTVGLSQKAATPSVATAPSGEKTPVAPDHAELEEKQRSAGEPASQAGDASEDRSKAEGPNPLDEDFFIFPKDESSVENSRIGGQISIIPYLSLLGILLFAFSIITLTYQVNPRPLESFIRQLPWYGDLIFTRGHLPNGLEFESLSSGFQTVRGNREVFIVSGKMLNSNARGVHDVRIEAIIYNKDGGKIDQKTIAMGNPFSPKIIQDMTEREIFLLQSLEPQNAFTIPPSDSVEFTIVFPKPEEDIITFSCRFVSAAVGTT